MAWRSSSARRGGPRQAVRRPEPHAPGGGCPAVAARARASAPARGATSRSRAGGRDHSGDAAGLRHLLVVPETHALIQARDLLVVGFRTARARTPTRPCSSISRRLVAGMSEYAAHGLLSYYDLELEGRLRKPHPLLSPTGRRGGENPVHRRPSRSRRPTTTRSGSTRAGFPEESSRTASCA